MVWAANDFEIPENLLELITNKFRSAHSLGTLSYTPSTIQHHEGTAFPYQIRILPTFNKKPNALQNQPQDSTTSSSQQKAPTALANIPPEHVISDAAGPFRIVLNRYCAVENQILLTSITPRSQSEALDAYELASVYRVLRALPRNHVAFYNCGKESGASQPHKHVQVVGLEGSEFEGLFPNKVKGRIDTDQPILVQHPNVPYTHFIIQLAAGCTGKHLQSLFNILLSATRSALEENNLGGVVVVPQYNFLMTLDWMMMIPRTIAACNGVGVNSLGMLGVLWLSNDEQFQIWSTTGFDEILARVGVPRRC